MRPPFLDDISTAYGARGKNVLLLTGGVNDLFYRQGKPRALSLDQVLSTELRDKFWVIRVDMAEGITFFDPEDEQAIIRISETKEALFTSDLPIQSLKRQIAENRYNPLAILALLKSMTTAFDRVRRMLDELRKDGKDLPDLKYKPLCIVIQHTGSLFPDGPGSELDRQRLVAFKTWVTGPVFMESHELVILVSSTKSKVQSEITTLPNFAHIEVPLPSEAERTEFVATFTSNRPVTFESDAGHFVRDTAGLNFIDLRDLLEEAARTGQPITRRVLAQEVNRILRARIGDIVSFKSPTHTPEDIIGYAATKAAFVDIFEACEDPSSAVAALVVSGPNGGGKTYQLEAFAATSGRVVIELAGLRGSYFGETERFFETFRFTVSTLGNVLILVDEAHTAFGSVHRGEVHETERRLSGNILKMMSDPALKGKVLWGLMSSRPDELDPDVLSRAPIQIPILDLDGDDRKAFVVALFQKSGIEIKDEELDGVLTQTSYYSARDLSNLIAQVLYRRKKNATLTVSDVLKHWQASRSIQGHRRFQALVAALNCSYPELLPLNLRELGEAEIRKQMTELKYVLGL